VGRTADSPTREYPRYEENEELKKRIHDAVYQGAYDVARSGNTSKAAARKASRK
jgi:polyribonucleotide nucleotidyltransferase